MLYTQGIVGDAINARSSRNRRRRDQRSILHYFSTLCQDTIVFQYSTISRTEALIGDAIHSILKELDMRSIFDTQHIVGDAIDTRRILL